MKTLLLAFGIFSMSSLAMAEQGMTLSFNNLNLASQESTAAQIDLSKELIRQSPGLNLTGQRLKSISVSGNSAELGATLVLLVSGRAIDSVTVQSSNEVATLSSNIGITPGQWMLAVRGKITLQQVVITLDAQGTTSDGPNFDPVAKKPMRAIPVEVPGEFYPEQTVLYVSPQNKVIQVRVQGLYEDGSVGILYNNVPYYIKDMKQLAVTNDCSVSGNYCVGVSVTAITATGPVIAKIIGIQNDNFIVISINGKGVFGNWPTSAIRFN